MQTRRRVLPRARPTVGLLGSALVVVLVLAMVATAVPAVAGAAPGDGPADRATAPDGGNVTERIVYFEEPADRGPSAAGGERTTADLREEARGAAAPLHRLADRREGLAIRRQFWITSATLVEIDTDRLSIDRLRAIDGVAAVEPNARVQDVGPVTAGDDASAAGSLRDPSGPEPTADSPTTASISTTGHGSSTWGLEHIDAPAAWSQYGTTGEGVRVAVLDTGVDADHPDLTVSEWASFDSAGDRTGDAPQDYASDGHGTHTAGTLTAGDGGGVHHGVAPGAELLAGAVLRNCDSERCNGSAAQMYAGMEWAVEQDADVISMSVGAIGYSEADIEYVRNAEAAGSMVVAAAGNRGYGTSASPANTFDAFGVGAVNASGDVPGFSSGETIDTDDDWNGSAPGDWPETYVAPRVTAPGAVVNSTLPGGTYGWATGTSMATPHVAGAAVLVESATETNLSPNELESALEDTAVAPDGADRTRYGAGVIDVDAAIAAVAETGSPAWAVSIDSVSSGVAGEPVVVTATVSNTGTADGAPTVTADLPGVGTNSTSVDVAAGGSETVTLSLPTSPGDDGTHTLSVTAGGDTDEEPVELLTPARFTVAIERVDETIAGDPLNVTTTVTNVGDVEGSVEVGLTVAGLGSTDSPVTVPAGAARSVPLDVPTTVADAGTYQFTVSAGNGTASGEATVAAIPPGQIEPGIARINGTVTDGAGGSIASQVWVSRVESGTDFTLAISRVGPGDDGSGRFELRRVDRPGLEPVERSGRDLRSAALGNISGLGIESPGATVRLVDPTGGDGAYDLSAPALDTETVVSVAARSNGTGTTTNDSVSVTAGDGRTRAIIVDQATAPSLEVDSLTLSPGGTVAPGASLGYDLAVSNAGDVTAEEPIAIVIDGRTVRNHSILLSGGNASRVTGEVSMSGRANGSHTISFEGSFGTVTRSFTIGADEWFSQYRGESGAVTVDGLLTGAAHYRSGELSATRLLALAESYRRGANIATLVVD